MLREASPPSTDQARRTGRASHFGVRIGRSAERPSSDELFTRKPYDSFDATDSITVCAFTTDETEAPLFRLLVEANERNGLRVTCRLMVDKLTTVHKSKVGARVG